MSLFALVLNALMSHKTVFTGEKFAAILIFANIWVNRGMKFSVFNQIVFSDKRFATIRPIALKPPPGVNVLMHLQVRLLPEPFAAVIPIADIWLIGGATVMATVVRIV